MPPKRKIINDPVYGFITLNHPLIFDILSHPYYQRLRRIHQMALAQLVYPGAVHTRLHHSLGAYHLMCNAVIELKYKDVDITPEEETAVKAAILLHDIGHGPFSHALEHSLVAGAHHEELSMQIIHEMNRQLDGRLQLALDIFTGNYHKPFLYQLISGQLDVDRMDYLSRDSFFTGVSEGVIGYDRILKMLVVHNGQLMIEEKGIYSVEKFLIARRQMYWQVYLHKAVLAAEKMLVKIIERVKTIYNTNDIQLQTNCALDYFLNGFNGVMNKAALDMFCSMDDTDMMFAIKRWSKHPDVVLQTLCDGILNRRLLKCQLHDEPIDEGTLHAIRQKVAGQLGISIEEAAFLVFSGEAVNTIYKMDDEHINVLFKDGQVKNIAQVYNPLIHQTLSTPVKKFYICQLK
ncbi:HD domain-containing protein [Foetidibacter luteolus]|uniref:HD domain-containing protein n=1 Tax=Foetidibacter luteolus TaxID=2608880 RepID=UPI00129A2CDD|nr:HD domain-containing protein [Foetidibacter luteolus]